MSEKQELIVAEYFPSIPRSEIVSGSNYRIPLNELSGLGSAFAVAAAEIGSAVKNAKSTEGLYRCVFPEGVVGKLAAFKDEPQYRLGTIINDHGIAAQARWQPVKAQSVAMSMNPATMALALALMNINRRLDDIQNATKEILLFLQQDKESALEGEVNSLADIFDHYRFNSDNENWMISELTNATRIKGQAEQSIIFYRKQIQQASEDRKLLHANHQVNKIVSKIQHNFKYYQLGVYLYAYASFLEVVLNGNYRKDYLEHVCGKLREYAQQYMFDYTEIYDRLDALTKTSVETMALKGIGKAGKGLGTAIAKIPIVSKGPVDEALIAAGDSVKEFGERHSENVMENFRNNRDAGIQLFMENIEALNRLSNKPVEMFFDKDSVYLCPCA